MIQVDLGRDAGLQRGDTGLVYFEVAAGDNLLTVQVGTGVVVEATALVSAVQVDRSAVVEPGHLVRFEIPERRLLRPEPVVERRTPIPGRLSEFYVAADVDPCLNVRPLPAKFARPVDCLPPGTLVEVVERVPGWRKARFPGGADGWLAEAFLSSSPTDARLAPPPPQTRISDLPDLEIMRQRLRDAEAALDSSEEARGVLEQRLQEAEAEAEAAEAAPAASETVVELRARVAESALKLDEVRSYRLKLQNALAEAEEARGAHFRRILDETVADLQEQLRQTAGDLRQTADERDALRLSVADANQELGLLRRRVEAAELSQDELRAERDRLAQEIESLRASPARAAETDQVVAELAAALEDLEQRRLEAKRRAISAEGRNTELEIRLERAETLVAELNRRLEEPRAVEEPEVSPSVSQPLRQSELQTIPPARREEPEAADLPPEAGRDGPTVATALTPQPPATAAPATRIEHITWRQENGSVVLVIALDGRVSKEDCEVVRVRSGQPRDVLKIRGIRRGVSPPAIEIGVGVLERLRTGLHWVDDRSEIHIVTDLSRPDVGIRTVQIKANTVLVTIS